VFSVRHRVVGWTSAGGFVDDASAMNSLHTPGAPFPTLVALLGERARAAPETTAFVYLRDGHTEATRLDHATLDRRARALAAALRSAGVQSGERALLLFPAGVEVLVALFGCLYAGVIAVPAPAPEASRVARTLPRLNAIADDAQASMLISCAETLEVIDSASLGVGGLASVHRLDVARVDESLATDWRTPAISGDTIAYLQYTSGSTATPKGVCLTHAQLLRHLQVLANHSCGYSSKTVTVCWMPYFHDYGLVEGMLLPLFNGTLCVLMSPYALIKHPANWLRAISRYRATHSQAPNFAYALCARKIDEATFAELDLRHWQCAGNAAEPINPDALTAFAQKSRSAGFQYESFYPGYGLAEATLIVTYKPHGESPRVGHFDRAALEAGRVRGAATDASPQGTRNIVSCGRPLKDTRVVIVDPETCTRAPADAVGEIWVSSPAVAGGYWRRHQDTEKTFNARLVDTGEGPFLRTGDLGFLYGGELYLCGRLKDLIIVHGQNISPQDIEWTVQAAHPALKPECGAAFSVEIEGEERLVVVQEIQGRRVRALDETAAFAAIRGAVGEAHGLELEAIVLLRPGGVSKTSSGKIQRSACRAMFLDGSLNAVATWRRPPDAAQAALLTRSTKRPSENALREFVLTRIAAAVGQPVELIDPREPFARFGLDSVRAVALAGDLETWLGCELPATLAFDYPNAAALARHLSAGERGDAVHAPESTRGRQPIAIIGIGCRFPGGIDDPEQFWEALRAGFDGVREVPAQRWNVDAWYAPEPITPGKMNSRWGGFIDDVDAFDAGFFAMSPREARFVDPQQRILLEVSWEALEHAGIAAERLAGTRTGVFVGICSNDYQRLQGAGASLQDGYAATGNALSIAANRISYTLDLVGPSWAVDTACSSSLVAVHHACRSLREGEADMALAGGVNLVLDPAGTVAFSQSRMMSPTGRCRTFSDDADGYVRAEGCGIVVLKRLADATRAGDRIIAVIRGSAVNQDGRSNGLTAPSGPSQQAVVRAALADAGVAAAEVGYVEAHGTGTPLGDPIELNALAAVLSDGRTPTQRCWVGSVKSNIGHLEGAAGIAGLIKAALCVERGEIPRNLHFRSLNPHIRIEGRGLDVATRTVEWAGESGARIAGVSSFGFGGTNAHVVVASPERAGALLRRAQRPMHLLSLSARDQYDLDRLVDSYIRRLKTLDNEAIADLCHTANVGRTGFPYRATATASDREGLLAALGFLGGRESVDQSGLYRGRVREAALVPLELHFGDRTFAPEAASLLYGSSPVFQAAVDALAVGLDSELRNDAMHVVRSGCLSDEGQHRRAALDVVFGCAIEALWRSWGVSPDAVSGVGSGLYVAAAAAGVMTRPQAVALALAATRDAGIGGATQTEAALDALDLQPPRVDLAGIPRDALVTREFWTEAARRGPVGARLCGGAEGKIVLGIEAAARHEPSGNGSQLSGMGDWRVLLDALAKLTHAGYAVDWTGFDRPYGYKIIDAPRYPFRRARHWFDGSQAIAEPKRPRAMSPDLPTAIVDTDRRGRARDLPIENANVPSGALATRRNLDAPIDRESSQNANDGRRLQRSLSPIELDTLSDDEVETLLRERLDSFEYQTRRQSDTERDHHE
jgi:acyl transferase domain-containing protein/acyl-CoA synthetase (AMP-forming)/AMP-acid ligase II/acyl carrier protein